MALYEKIFGTYSEREIKRINKKYVNKINKLEETISKLSDEDLQAKTLEFKNRLSKGETLEDILPEAFAVCREASKRVLGMRHFDVQLIGGCVLHEGRVAEMKTGEGKTLVATLPTYLNALSGNGVHVVTVNDYLAHRDRDIMKPLYDFLGVTSEVIISSTPAELRKDYYNADIVYITNTELGFDYLRDNMATHPSQKVQRKLNFALVDEVDSILIDEARTPLIISSASDKPNHLYSILDVFVKALDEDEYDIDKEKNTVSLTEKGVAKAELIFGLENYADIEHNLIRHHMQQSLKAVHGMKKDKDYIVKDGQVVIIDEFTGRIADGRRFSNGLHQALEAKEGVKIQAESVTLATITYQNFFKLYNKLSGMTGTAETEQIEFNTTYCLDVVVIPTNLPIARKDKDDKIFMTEQAKFKAIIKDIAKNHAKGRPVLVGTPTIEKSEILSELLKKEGIPHQVLNAKYHEIEAEIIAKAGDKGAVTIATNMAGRGTDIKLTDEVKALGGLKVIGSERAENRRVDNQLRGRSGRQGDPGVSQFYLSFEDDLIRFVSDKYRELIDNADKEDERPIKNKFLSKVINMCQRKIESQHYEARKNTLEYDNVVNKQRTIVYTQRDTILNAEDLTEQLEHIVSTVISKVVKEEITNQLNEGDIDEVKLIKSVEPLYLDKGTISVEELKDIHEDELPDFFVDKALEVLKTKAEEVGEDFTDIAKGIFISNIDAGWKDNIAELDDLKQDVKFMAFKNEDPIKEYIIRSFEMFSQMVFIAQSDTVKYLLKLNTVKKQPTGSPITIDGVEFI